MKAITVRQPWAWLIIHGGKNIENRSWYSAYQGYLVIHAASKMSRSEYEDARDFVRTFDPELACKIPHHESLAYGYVLGTVQQIGCVKHHDSPWFQGEFGHVYRMPSELIVPIPAVGHLNLWDWEVPKEGLMYAERTQPGTDRL
jgi:hypothetical protein